MSRFPTAIAALAIVLAGCSSEPETVLQSDLPQVPGMAPRDTTGLRQEGGRITAGQFAYTGNVPTLDERAAETMSRFGGMGWSLRSQTMTSSTAVLVYAKDDRTARIEIIRNGVQPKMSTAVLRVESASEAPVPAPTPAAEPAPTPAPATDPAPAEPVAGPG